MSKKFVHISWATNITLDKWTTRSLSLMDSLSKNCNSKEYSNGRGTFRAGRVNRLFFHLIVTTMHICISRFTSITYYIISVPFHYPFLLIFHVIR